ncbi:hypothetical protein [Citrobacter braakii]|uniref:hypothetical protein n=1 Tax=Citrobacter braakii TaxID=57706 RepID=UPI00403A6A1E
MIADHISEHVQMAEQAQEWLRARGSRVESLRVFMRRPLLVIACPPSELVNSAERISENSGGGSRSVWVASLNGCRVMWR